MMAQSWGPSTFLNRNTDTTSTTTGDTYYVGVSVSNGYEDTQASAWTWSLREHVREFEQVLTEKQLRDRAAARAHADAMRAAVRSPGPPAPVATRSRHGHYAGPRMSCHTGTRTR